jgi:hypothetical protein
MGHYGKIWATSAICGVANINSLVGEIKSRILVLQRGRGFQKKHVKVAEIEVRMMVAHVGPIPIDWGYDCIVDALERNDALLDFEIPVAVKWIDSAGKSLYTGAVDGKRRWLMKDDRSGRAVCRS